MIPVEGHKHLFREESGAIVSTDANGLNDIAPMQAKTVVETLQEKP